MRKTIFRSLGTIAAVIACVYFLPGVTCQEWLQAVMVGALLAAAYVLFRPAARILLGIFNLLTLGLMGVIIDAGLFYACASWVNGFYVESFGWALAASLIVNLVRLLFGAVSTFGDNEPSRERR